MNYSARIVACTKMRYNISCGLVERCRPHSPTDKRLRIKHALGFGIPVHHPRDSTAWVACRNPESTTGLRREAEFAAIILRRRRSYSGEQRENASICYQLRQQKKNRNKKIAKWMQRSPWYESIYTHTQKEIAKTKIIESLIKKKKKETSGATLQTFCRTFQVTRRECFCCFLNGEVSILQSLRALKNAESGDHRRLKSAPPMRLLH